MAEPVLLSDGVVWVAGYDIAGYLNDLKLSASKAEQKNNVLGDTLETAHPGIATVEAMLAGFWGSGTTGLEVDPFAWSRLGTPGQALMPVSMVAPYSPNATPNTEGNIGYSLYAELFSSNAPAAKHGDLIPIALSTKPRTTGRLCRQWIGLAKATRGAATTTGTAVQLASTIAATQSLVAILHVFSGAANITSVIIESDDNAPFATPTTRLTFSLPAAAPGFAIAIVSGAIATDTYFRVKQVTSGSASSAVLFSVETT